MNCANNGWSGTEGWIHYRLRTIRYDHLWVAKEGLNEAASRQTLTRVCARGIHLKEEEPRRTISRVNARSGTQPNINNKAFLQRPSSQPLTIQFP